MPDAPVTIAAFDVPPSGLGGPGRAAGTKNLIIRSS